MEALVTFQDGVSVQTAIEVAPMSAVITFQDGPAVETEIGSDMTIVLTGGIGPMGLQGPKGDPGNPEEITTAEIDEILGVDNG